MKINLKNSTSGAVKKVQLSFSWTCLFFGGFVPLFRGDFRWTFGYLVATAITMGIYHVIFPFTYNSIYVRRLLASGYVPADEYSASELSKKGLIEGGEHVPATSPVTVVPTDEKLLGDSSSANASNISSSAPTTPVNETASVTANGIPHILGKSRFPIVLALSVIGVIVQSVYLPNFTISEGLNQISSRFICFIAGLIFFWILTVENLIKLTISLALGSGAGFISIQLVGSAFPNLKEYEWLIALAICIVTAACTKVGLDSSSWIGTPCPKCYTRGKLDYKQISKEFLGTRYGPPKYSLASTQKDHRSWHKYIITEKHWCDACSHEWIETRETEEGA